MSGRYPLLVITFSLALLSIDLPTSHGSTITHCQEIERKALIEFSHGLHDPSNRLFSWVDDDCCTWEGVGCSNFTGHVVKLDLRNRRRSDLSEECSDDTSYLRSDNGSECKWAMRGYIRPSLLSLQHLNHLDLSGNYFEHIRIPEFLGSFKRLTYLNLSGAGFLGRVPDQLGNLSTLHQLDLSYNGYLDDDGLLFPGLYLESPGWISQLTSLRRLNMNWGVSFKNASSWLQALNALPYIQQVELVHCDLGNFPHSLPHVNFTSLITLNLRDNNINSSIPDWVFNTTSLQYLELGGNYFSGLLPDSIGKLTSLRALDLSGHLLYNGFIPIDMSNLCKLQSLSLSSVPINDLLANLEVVFSGCLMFSLEKLDIHDTQLSGSVPDWLGNIKNLKYLDLSDNSLYGSVPACLGNLSLLQYLDVSNNYFNGTFATSIGQLRDLAHLDLSYNSLSLSHVHFANLSSLTDLNIESNFVWRESDNWFPPFQLENFIMDSCKIGPGHEFPKWLRTQRTLKYLDLTSVGIKDVIPNWLPSTLEYLYLSNNEITGEVPQYFPYLVSLHLSNNSFSGHLPTRIANIMPVLRKLYLDMNNLSGSIPSSFCQIRNLQVVRLSKNNFSGGLPDCWKISSKLFTLDFSSNNLNGGIPNSLCNLQRLQLLRLSHNNLSGPIPLCLKSWTSLDILDLSHNNFIGNVPKWTGETLPYLRILVLRSNAFTGSIPTFFLLASLQILDLSNNNLSGTIPPSFGNFTAMKLSLPIGYYTVGGYNEDMWLSTEGSEFEYSSWQLSLVTVIDLSNNGLSGYIPEELGNLHELRSLNLSGNCLTGAIPNNISGMQHLEILDLSKNNLSGAIPSSLAALNFLNHLNLSYNNLSGRIPTGNQLQTFIDSSIYAGNLCLCGPPLTKDCTVDNNEEEQNDNNQSRTETIWLCTSIVLGFIIGFWAIIGTLLLQRRWRIAYFRAIDNMYDRLYVVMAVNMRKFEIIYPL